MIQAWAARSADKSRIRIDLDPLDPRQWAGWSLRQGEVTPEEWVEMSITGDDVRREQIHQDIWARWGE